MNDWMPLQRTGLAVRMDLLDEKQAMKNHGQTLAQLAQRCGLSPCEAVALAERREWKGLPDALKRLEEIAPRPLPTPEEIAKAVYGIDGDEWPRLPVGEREHYLNTARNVLNLFMSKT